MLNGLGHMDQKVARSCAEFFSGIVRIVQPDNQSMNGILPHLLPLMLQCCRFTDADQMSVVQSKDGDHMGQSKDDEEDDADEDDGAEEGGEKNYEIGASAHMTLRRSAAYALVIYSQEFPEQTL